MMKQIFTILAAITLIGNALTPLALADTTQLSGNGAESNNTANSTTDNSTKTVQSNNANIDNTVSNNQDTGHNSADYNTGGNVTVDTGSALSTTSILNRANANVANTSGVLGNGGNSDPTLISGNGAFSNNHTSANTDNSSSLTQKNQADVSNNVTNRGNTGYNSADYNTGGDTTVLTGNAGASTDLSTAVNGNVAQGGSIWGNGSGNGSNVVVRGNGARSDNSVDLSNNSSAKLVQNNKANIDNNVYSNLNTGYNSADYNTGGNVGVDTGNAISKTSIDNMANFNSADLGGFVTGGGNDYVKVAGNGAFSDNHVNSHNNDSLSNFQSNYADVYNNVKNKGQTGYNSATYNTGALTGVDPVDVVTGHSLSNTGVTTTANANVLGSNGSLQLPGGANVNLTFDMASLLNGLKL